MEDKSAPQEGPREGAAPASPGAGPNSPLQAANKHDAPPKAEAPQNSPGSLRDITNAADDAFWAAAADAASQAEAEALEAPAPVEPRRPRKIPSRLPEDTAPGGSSHRRDKPQVDLCDCHLFLSVE